MKVKQTIDVYELDSTEPRHLDAIGIDSHPIFRDRVVLIVGGHRYTVLTDELQKAISNATNH